MQIDSLTISFIYGIQALRLPLLKTTKNGYPLYFIIDTGANKNYIRQDFLKISDINEDTHILDDIEEFHSIDNVCHKTQLCNFRFNLGDYKCIERYQIIEDGSALIFPTNEGTDFHVAGILGTSFLVRYKAIIDFVNCKISLSLPVITGSCAKCES